MNTDEYYMERALQLAEQAALQGEVPVGAVIVAQGSIIGEGWNRPISTNDPTAHAEIIALRDAALRIKNYRLSNSVMYVTIEPCTMCAGALVHARVSRLVYGATEPKSGAIESNDCGLNGEHLNHHMLFTGGVLADRCSVLMSSFFNKRRRAKK